MNKKNPHSLPDTFNSRGINITYISNISITFIICLEKLVLHQMTILVRIIYDYKLFLKSPNFNSLYITSYNKNEKLTFNKYNTTIICTNMFTIFIYIN